MQDAQFDQLSKSLSTTTSRRQALKIFGLTAGTGVLSLVGSGRARAADPGRCRNVGTVCRESTECCSKFCDPATARCACGPGSQICPSTGICVTCTGTQGTQVFDPETCECSCENPITCVTQNDCCLGFFCGGGAKGEPRTCRPCTNVEPCTGSSDCCPGFVCLQGGACVPAV